MVLNQGDIHLYADDAVQMKKYKNPDEAFSKLNRDLERLNSLESQHLSTARTSIQYKKT